MDVVFVVQIFRGQSRTKPAIDIATQYLQRHAFALQSLQESAHIPLALADLLGGLPLRDQALPCFLQCDQPVAVSLRL